ncbi:glutathione-disulfide reductase [Parvularcula sp. ZS-1/3]|uniref:Glutathione-disulfide reductase n=1 Tax=Parvularcula mediterranea TaxID=2732508 RepID=A0A7Y3W6G6_9PROT|nr:glutathione-disulfide reductase [Parvularcula mediterranea]NNU17709.1 glutathione-disulfide reductase [Parvularcula mediterranea]
MAYDYDLFVIGAGSGGVRAARLTAQAGFKVACAEESMPGGTCVVRGCVPKKFFVFASEYGHMMEDAKGYGWSFPEAPKHDWPTLRDNVQAEVQRLSGIYSNILEKNGVDHIKSRVVLVDPHTVHIVDEDRQVTADKILIAVGGRPIIDESIPGAELGIVSDDAFLLPELPKRAVVAGGGYIAVEFAYIMAGLGVDVTLVYRGERVLRGFDPDLAAYVESNFERAGIRYINNTVFTKIEEQGGAKHVHLMNGETLETDLVFWAIGRRPNTNGLGVDRAGIETDRAGAIVVNDDSQTNQPSVFAVGDVTNRVNLTPVAIREAAAFVETQFKDNPRRMDYADIPKAVFSQPPVASVGMTSAEAKAAGYGVDVYMTNFRAMKNVLADNPERVIMKLVVCQKTDKVLGCHIAGTEAGEMVQVAAIAVKAGLTKAQFDATCALHPTVAEELVTLTNVVEE